MGYIIRSRAILDIAGASQDAELAEHKRVAAQPKWEEYAHNTWRLEVPGGHLFRLEGYYGGLVFVPGVA